MAADASNHLYIIVSDWFNTVLIVLSIQHVSAHAHRYPSFRTTSQNFCNFLFSGDGSRFQIELAQLTSWNEASFPAHTCENVTYWKYFATTRWICPSSNSSVMEESSFLNSTSDLNVRSRSAPSHRRSLSTSMRTSGHILKTPRTTFSMVVSD